MITKDRIISGVTGAVVGAALTATAFMAFGNGENTEKAPPQPTPLAPSLLIETSDPGKRFNLFRDSGTERSRIGDNLTLQGCFNQTLASSNGWERKTSCIQAGNNPQKSYSITCDSDDINSDSGELCSFEDLSGNLPKRLYE